MTTYSHDSSTRLYKDKIPGARRETALSCIFACYVILRLTAEKKPKIKAKTVKPSQHNSLRYTPFYCWRVKGKEAQNIKADKHGFFFW